MKDILLVEDNDLFAAKVKDKFKTDTDFNIIWSKSFTDTVKILKKKNKYNFISGILDFKLPDAMNGEVIDLVVSKGIPAIIFTGYVDKEIRDVVWSKSVIDYVLKEDYQSMDYIISLIHRIEKNPGTKVIVVDNFLTFRKVIENLLRVHKYDVYTAKNGKEAMNLLKKNPDTKIVITEYNIPEMNGLELTHKIRETYTKDHLAIIGMSSENEKMITTRFLKYGANDFIQKQSFMTEEFYRRITQNIENLEHINYIKEAAIKDYLTGLFNRRYFFEVGQKLTANVARGNINVICAMIDIDHFKKVNDTHGHKAGDVVLQKISLILKERMRESDLVARIGGEEFCILAVNMKKEYVIKVFKDLCKKIQDTEIKVGEDTKVKITVSIGVTAKPKKNLDELIIEADRLLFKAKKKGRNRIAADIK